MRPLSVDLVNVGLFDELHIDLPEGCVAITGANGAGKSTILKAIEAALFAGVGKQGASTDLAAIKSPYSDDMTLLLEFEHARERYRIRRGYRERGAGTGTATLDLETALVHNEDDSVYVWTPITRETAAATQTLIEETIGLSRRAFRASSFLAQREASAFLTASATEKKQVLGEILDARGLWPRLLKDTADERKEVAAQLAAGDTLIASLESTAAEVSTLEETLEDLRRDQAAASRAVDDADEKLQAVQAEVAANAAAAERARALTDAVASARKERGRAAAERDQAEQMAAKLPGAREKVAELETLAASVPELQERQRGYQDARALYDRESQKKARWVERARDIDLRLTQARSELQRAEATRQKANVQLEELAHAEADAAHCDRCQQILGEQARQAAIESLRREIVDHEDACTALAANVAESGEQDINARKLIAAFVLPDVPTREAELACESRLDAARRAAEQTGTVKHLIAEYMEHADSLDVLKPALVEAERALAVRERELTQATAGAADAAKLERAAAEARAAVTTARSLLDAANAHVTQTTERLARAQAAKTQLAELKQSRAAQQTELDLLHLEEQAYGPNGIPVLIAENALGTIEADTNWALGLLPTEDGATFRADFVTQAAHKTRDGVKETLEVTITAPGYEQKSESLSGGEESRVALALRFALAARIGESRIMIVDELPFLDDLGDDTVVGLLHAAVDRGLFETILVVSHSPNVQDAFDHVIRVEKRDGISTIVSAREEVAA